MWNARPEKRGKTDWFVLTMESQQTTHVYHKSYICLFCVQHCHSWSFTITGVLLTHYSLYKQNAHKWGHSSLLLFFIMCLTPDWTACSRMCVICLCVRWAVRMKRELDVNGRKLPNSLFLISTANVSSPLLEAETVDMFIYHPSHPSMRWCIYILILTWE